MKRFLLALALLFAPASTWAQCNGVFPAHTFCGNATGSPAIPQAVAQSNVTMPAGLNGEIQYNNNGVLGGYSSAAATAYLSLFTSSLQGLVPSSGGGTSNFLRADGTWTSPTGVTAGKTANYPIVSTDCNSTVVYGTGSTAQITATLPALPSAGFTAGCTISVKNANVYAGPSTGHATTLSGFPADLNVLLWPGQTAEVQVNAAATGWITLVNPGRWRPPQTVTWFVDTGASSSDANDGLSIGAAGAGAMKTIGQCDFTYASLMDFTSAQGQPICGPTAGQTFTESVVHATPALGTNTLNIIGQGGQFTWKPSGVNPFVMLVANGSNVQLTNVNVSGTGTTCFGTVCELLKVHNGAVLETLANVTCTDAGAAGFCIRTDQNTAGGGQINVDNGLSVAGTVGGVVDLSERSSLLWNSTLIAVATPTVGQVFAARSNSVICIAGNFVSTGTWGAARQWAILNNAILLNTSGNVVPGSTIGITTAVGFTTGIAIATGAGGC